MRFQNFAVDLISRVSNLTRFNFAKMAKIREITKFNLAKINPIKVVQTAKVYEMKTKSKKHKNMQRW